MARRSCGQQGDRGWARRASTPPVPKHDGVRRSTPYGGGLHNVSPAPASAALAAQVVTGAGPTSVDAVDATLKADFTNGTGRFYNGAGYPAPNPTW